MRLTNSLLDRPVIAPLFFSLQRRGFSIAFQKLKHIQRICFAPTEPLEGVITVCTENK